MNDRQTRHPQDFGFRLAQGKEFIGTNGRRRDAALF